MWIIHRKENPFVLAVGKLFETEEAALEYIKVKTENGSWAGTLKGKFAVRFIQVYGK